MIGNDGADVCVVGLVAAAEGLHIVHVAGGEDAEAMTDLRDEVAGVKLEYPRQAA